ncbi:MAG: A/G-specific adenine glycosylase [Mariprofundaceae bacterium]|nr:A/G-specific adenine glycosylase [Mariprofundaceae bacterium]
MTIKLFSEPFSLPPLLAWYEANKRDLPWRHSTNPYHLWMSEIMLQQTQVVTVLPRYAAWLAAFPTITALAEADEDEVMKAWEGLGYYRRARYAHAAAKQIMVQHGGVFPRAFDDILALPGIGRSTAGAIASFAFGDAYPVLDGNVQRVLHRYFGASKNQQQWQQAETMIKQSKSPALWNQAMMELGATCCHRSKPSCVNCPMQQQCLSAFQTITPMVTKNKIKVRDVYWQVQCYGDPLDEKIWLVRRPNRGIWGGLWSPPIDESYQQGEKRPTLVHTLTHRRLHLYGACMQCPPPAAEGAWFLLTKLPALPTGIRRLLAIMLLE